MDRRTLDGEIVTCADVAWSAADAQRRQAGSRRSGGTSVARRAALELALYVAHGVLHLAGHDDRTPRGFRRMHERENRLLAQLGLGRVF